MQLFQMCHWLLRAEISHISYVFTTLQWVKFGATSVCKYWACFIHDKSKVHVYRPLRCGGAMVQFVISALKK